MSCVICGGAIPVNKTTGQVRRGRKTCSKACSLENNKRTALGRYHANKDTQEYKDGRKRYAEANRDHIRDYMRGYISGRLEDPEYRKKWNDYQNTYKKNRRANDKDYKQGENDYKKALRADIKERRKAGDFAPRKRGRKRRA